MENGGLLIRISEFLLWGMKPGRTEGNRPRLLMKPRELSHAKIGRILPPAFEQINRQIPPEPHTAMYVWHKYWSRKTWNVVGEHIRAYAREQEVVFDPFAGSGVTAIEAARSKRRAIVCDLNPCASRITELTLRPVNVLKLTEAFEGCGSACRSTSRSFTPSIA